jgi:hypothetical protein
MNGQMEPDNFRRIFALIPAQGSEFPSVASTMHSLVFVHLLGEMP